MPRRAFLSSFIVIYVHRNHKAYKGGAKLYWNVSMVNIHLRKLGLWVYCLGHAGVKGNDRADTRLGLTRIAYRQPSPSGVYLCNPLSEAYMGFGGPHNPSGQPTCRGLHGFWWATWAHLVNPLSEAYMGFGGPHGPICSTHFPKPTWVLVGHMGPSAQPTFRSLHGFWW